MIPTLPLQLFRGTKAPRTETVTPPSGVCVGGYLLVLLLFLSLSRYSIFSYSSEIGPSCPSIDCLSIINSFPQVLPFLGKDVWRPLFPPKVRLPRSPRFQDSVFYQTTRAPSLYIDLTSSSPCILLFFQPLHLFLVCLSRNIRHRVWTVK